MRFPLPLQFIPSEVQSQKVTVAGKDLGVYVWVFEFVDDELYDLPGVCGHPAPVLGRGGVDPAVVEDDELGLVEVLLRFAAAAQEALEGELHLLVLEELLPLKKQSVLLALQAFVLQA
jgi:hypothetical protein